MLDDSVVHRACLDNWESRDEFVAAWNRESQGVFSDKLVVTRMGTWSPKIDDRTW